MEIRTLIVGYGIVGKHLEGEIKALNPDVTDIKFPPPHFPKRDYDRYDAIFICVDTPYVDDKTPCDLTAVRNAIKSHIPLLDDEGVFVIKSTVPPYTTEQLQSEFCRPIIHSPEYYGATMHCNNFDFDFTVLGGNEIHCIKIQHILQHCYDARHRFFVVDAAVAELAKYMENSWLATKVSFCGQFYKIAENLHIPYEKVREIFISDPRVHPSHTFVYPGHPYWDSHCLNKDTAVIAARDDADFIKCVIKFNESMKK